MVSFELQASRASHAERSLILTLEVRGISGENGRLGRYSILRVAALFLLFLNLYRAHALSSAPIELRACPFSAVRGAAMPRG